MEDDAKYDFILDDATVDEDGVGLFLCEYCAREEIVADLAMTFGACPCACL